MPARSAGSQLPPSVVGGSTPGSLTPLADPHPLRQALLAVTLTTRAAHDGSVVPAVVGWAVDHGHLRERDRLAAETALSEALANAIVHGSLGLPGMEAYGQAVEAYFVAVSARLATDTYGLRPIRLVWRRAASLVVLHVEDTGSGYDPRHRPAHTPHTAGSGRGRLVMAVMARRVRVSCGGRRVTLGFVHA